MTEYQWERRYGSKRSPRRSNDHLAANSLATKDAKVNTDYLQCLVGKSRILYLN